MNKGRLEAFSDGVFAIVITLLILDIKIPEVQPAALPAALVDILPQILTYVLSFFIVGLYWHMHHQGSVTCVDWSYAIPASVPPATPSSRAAL